MALVEVDKIPNPGDQGVQNVLRDLEGHLRLRGTIAMIENVGKHMYISTNAAARDAKQLVKIQDCLFSIIKLNDACSLMMQSFQSGANNILEKLKVAYLYLLDGFPDFAMTDIEAISKDVGTMRSAVDKHLDCEKKTADQLAAAHALVKGENKEKKRDLNTISMKKEMKKREIEEIKERIRIAKSRPDDDGESNNQQGKSSKPSKLYLALLILFALEFAFHSKLCDVFVGNMTVSNKCRFCLQAHVGLGIIVLLVQLLKWLVDRSCRKNANGILICLTCFLLFFPSWYRHDMVLDGIIERQTIPGNETEGPSSSSAGYFTNAAPTTSYAIKETAHPQDATEKYEPTLNGAYTESEIKQTRRPGDAEEDLQSPTSDSGKEGVPKPAPVEVETEKSGSSSDISRDKDEMARPAEDDGMKPEKVHEKQLGSSGDDGVWYREDGSASAPTNTPPGEEVAETKMSSSESSRQEPDKRKPEGTEDTKPEEQSSGSDADTTKTQSPGTEDGKPETQPGGSDANTTKTQSPGTEDGKPEVLPSGSDSDTTKTQSPGTEDGKPEVLPSGSDADTTKTVFPGPEVEDPERKINGTEPDKAKTQQSPGPEDEKPEKQPRDSESDTTETESLGPEGEDPEKKTNGSEPDKAKSQQSSGTEDEEKQTSGSEPVKDDTQSSGTERGDLEIETEDKTSQTVDEVKELERDRRDVDGMKNGTGDEIGFPFICHQPEEWYKYPLVLVPYLLVVLLSKRASNDRFFIHIIVGINIPLVTVLFWFLVNDIHGPLEFIGTLGVVELAKLGVMEAIFLATVISFRILLSRPAPLQPGEKVPPFEIKRLEDELRIALDEEEDLKIDRKSVKELLSTTELSDVLFDKTFPFLAGIEENLSKSIELVETWYKECKDVVEPNMGMNIDRAASIDEEERQRYWNSLQFKQEVVGYYCRWRALQVYCEENRRFIRAARQRIENWYTENLLPREAVAKSWQQAAELGDPDVSAFLNNIHHEEDDFEDIERHTVQTLYNRPR